MEDQKGPGPKKKVLVRKSTVTKESVVPEDAKESPTPESEWKYNMSEKEREQRSLGASGDLSSSTGGLKSASIGKKLTPLTEEEQKEGTRNLEKIKPEEASYYVDNTLGYKKGNVPTASAITTIDKISKIVDGFGSATVAEVKDLFEGAYGKKMLERSGLTENEFKELTREGSDEGKKNFYYSILQRVNEKRKDLGDLKATRSSVVVEPIQKVPTPESDKVVENRIDSAVKLIKDSKGKVRQEMKDTK